MKRDRSMAAIFAVLLFCCGAAAGALAHRYFTANVVNAKSADDFRRHYMSEMQTKLKLTPAQADRLEVILDQTKKKYKAVRDQYHPAMLQIRTEQISQVKSILTPEQVPAYERLVADHERHAKEQEDRDRMEDQKREAAHRAKLSP